MPIVNGEYRVPPNKERGLPSRISCCQLALVDHLWNMLAYQHDDDQANVQIWIAKSVDAATSVRRVFDPLFGQEEAELSVADCWMRAQRRFARDLEQEGRPDITFNGIVIKTQSFRERRGQEIGFQ